MKAKLGFDILFDQEFESEIVGRLSADSTINVSRRPNGWHYDIRHRSLTSISGMYSHSDLSRRPTLEEIAKDAYGRHCAGLISDVSASRLLGLPLLQPAETSWVAHADRDLDSSEHAVALNIRLPSLTRLSAKEVLRLRKDEWPDFERFRSALRVAIREQVDRSGSGSPEEIAQSVIDEYVEPELADIERELRSIRRTLIRKVDANIAIGGTAVSVGAIVSVPLVIATGVAALAASVAQIHRYFDDKREVELSDLYFLWRARGRHRD